MRPICINVSPLLGSITGIERCIYENIKRIDKLAHEEGIEVTILFPNGTTPNLPELKYITKKELPANGSKLRIIDILKYLKETNSVYFSMHGGLCLFKDSVVCTNDIRTWMHSEYDPVKFRLKCNINVISSRIFSAKMVTISNTAADEISSCLKIPRNQIAIISPGWEHIKSIKADESIWERIPYATKGNYYYSLSSRAPHKNFKWVIEVAKRNPDEVFLIGGKAWNGEAEGDIPNNIHYLGYVTDEENKELMQSCKAFLHPSKYEGFGMTPLEALACGAPICVSNASCLPEVFEDCAHYFDPDCYDVNLKELIENSVANPEKLFHKYSWDKSSKLWVDLMKEFGK